MKPIIGITNCSKIEDYIRSVEQSGGTPRVLRYDEDPEALISSIDGLLLTGGGDVDPQHYGESAHPSVKVAEAGRDAFEIAASKLARERDIPVLAICRGAQVLNVARGGTLVQDIPTNVDTELNHSLTTPPDAQAHDIHVSAHSVLARALGASVSPQSTCRVNSRHHQSIGVLGSGLAISARASDEIVEAIEDPAARFCLGVQWHPENFWRTGEFKPLFDAFIAASRR